MSLLNRLLDVVLPCALLLFRAWGSRRPRGQWQPQGLTQAREFSQLRCRWQPLDMGALLCVLATSLSNGSSTVGAVITLVDRTVTQDQGAWIVDYRLRHMSKTGMIITPAELAVKVEGWVSNSRVASHTVPRWSSLNLSPGGDLSATSEVITAPDETHRCRERLVVSIWTEDQGCCKSNSRGRAETKAEVSRPPGESMSGLLVSLAPNAIVHVCLRLEHQHILYGDYDPLLATRAVTLTLGSAPIRDVVSLDREQYLAQPRFSWAEPLEERRDTRHAISKPDSLHLEAHVPGHQHYRYPERPVRYSTKMRLRFWYLIAAGTDGECQVRLEQYKETPISWRKLNSGSFQQCLKTVGRWIKVERIIQTEPEATTLTLEFNIASETEVGEMWIDDVSLDPVGSNVPGGP